MASHPNFQDTQPAPLHELSGNTLDEFLVDHPNEQVALLRQLAETGVLIHLSARDGTSYTTMVWAVDASRRRVSLSADAAQPQVHALVDAGEVTAVAYLDSIKLQFDLHNLMLVHGANASALQAAFPSALYRFQRRDSFRVRIPAGGAPTASLRDPAPPHRVLALRVLDISIGGCALALPKDVPPLAAGSTIAGVRIEIDANTRFEASLTVQHVSAGMGSTQSTARMGCAFGRLDGAAQRSLQLYIDQTQKRQRLFTLR